MNQLNLQEKLCCVKCHNNLNIKSVGARCTACGTNFEKKAGIWNFLPKRSKITSSSQNQYETIHEHEYGPPLDGSYQILSSIARGNTAVDIASGVGFISKLSKETVAVDFSLNALLQARNFGAKHLVLADAQLLPFKDDSFDIAISSGSLEHFENPQKAVDEMARISTIQVIIAHKLLPIPFAKPVFNLATKIFRVKHQPIEQPLSENQVVSMLKKAKLHVVFKGVWTLPVNYGRVIKILPEFKNTPSCLFFISIKKTKIDKKLIKR